MPIIHKAVACVVRRDPGQGPALLCFRHPLAGVQIPKGTVEHGEDIAAATLRELEEETGLTLTTAPDFIGTWDRDFADGAVHRWHIGLLPAPDGVPDTWRHRASGSPAEDGLIFDLHWLPVDGRLPARLDPLFAPAARLIAAALA